MPSHPALLKPGADTAPSPGGSPAPINPEPDKPGLIDRGCRFIDLETPVDLLTDWITPVNRFYVRNHLFEPTDLNAATWRLTINGEVDNPITLTLADLQSMPVASVTTALECAGNGRTQLDPKVPGTAWGKGAIGNAGFSGPSLRAVLQLARIRDSARHVKFRGLDWGPEDVPPFIRSIPIEKAMDGDSLIATHMNGECLTMHHGYPARAVTPGWVGAASCKWLTEITVLTQPADEYFMSQDYRLPNTPCKPGEHMRVEDTYPLTELTVKSLITAPADGTRLRSGLNTIHGVAWAGEADVTKVEVSTDAGASWSAAQLGEDHARYAWRQWSFDWKPARSGDYAILSRATDSRGRVQPDHCVWNPGGYLNNVCDRVKVSVQG